MATSGASNTTSALQQDGFPNIIDLNRANSPRSALIAEKVERAKADWEVGNHQTFADILEEYVPLDLMDVAMTTFNLLRIPFQTQRPVADQFAGCILRGRIELTNAWGVALYFTDILGDWEKFHKNGDPIDQVLFHRALRLNWEEERAQRASLLTAMHRKGIVDVSVIRPTLYEWNQSWTPINEFHFSIFRARTNAIFSRLGLNEAQQERVLETLEWDDVHRLGIQARALALPQAAEDYYDPKFIAHMVRTNRHMKNTLGALSASEDNWEDGWYQRFPAALPPLQG
ncbi:hypothetical protein N0V84_000471 [Fusarium piperis]|uniref:Uncharacterized protein n=1 Tax=Fusarium piperis TaxID=1435070 RepID=A0A9W8WN69_9HYPO|nr:hypothetical protein N0V84_000471 [Fusarium piperis]